MAKKSKKDKEVQLPEKLTIYEYEQKYTKHQNVRGAKIALKLIAATIGIGMAACLFLITMKVVDLFTDQRVRIGVGVGMGLICLGLYIAFFIVPLVKILKTGYFEVNVNAYTAREAQKHNKKVRHDIAHKIIELTSKVEGVGWYDSEVVGSLAIALHGNDEESLKQALTELYTGSVKKSAKSLINKTAMRSAMYSALSQTDKVDALLVAFLNLQLVKDLVFLYGFRPSDPKLVRIFARVLQNSLIAYGLGTVKIGNSIVKTMGDVVKGIPILGSAISVLVDSSVQGLTNGVLTAVIGYQTIKYLSDEYKLQNILDGVEIAETEEELQEVCLGLEKELKSGHSKMPQAV
ncbi:MAG: YcjF family protein [Clostridia bacterium]|nr:YcjF family protein [Clostridia bacterium]